MTRAEAIAEWLENGAKASRHYHERGGHSEGRVKAQEALLELAVACAVEDGP